MRQVANLDVLSSMVSFFGMSPPITLNFEEDVRRQIIKALTSAGYTVNEPVSLERLVRQFLNYEHRLILPRPRKAFRSRELSQKFCALAVRQRQVLEEIERKSQVGENLNIFLSENLTDLDYDDLLLNDWHIYHLHLGSSIPRRNGFVKRSRELVYVYIQDNALYMIDVLDHKAFGKQELVEILHFNWPHAIEKFRATGFSAGSTRLSAKQRERIRYRGVNSLVVMPDDTAYWPFGGGYSSAGLGTRAVIGTDVFLDKVKQWEIGCRNSRSQILANIEAQTKMKLKELYLELIFMENEWIIIECQTNIRIMLNFRNSPLQSAEFQI